MNPFSEDLQSLTLAQLDWIVEMIAKDNPDKIRLSRNGDDGLPEGAKDAVLSASIWDGMRGKAKENEIKRLFTPEQLKKIKSHARRKDRPDKLYVNPAFPLPS